MKYKDHNDFFKHHAFNSPGGLIDAEEVFQHFKARLLSELRVVTPELMWEPRLTDRPRKDGTA